MKHIPTLHILKRVSRNIGCILVYAAFACTLVKPVDIRAQVNAEQVLNIGRNVLSMEDYLLAIQYFNLAIKAKPYLADAYFFRGLAKLSLDDYEGAVADCTLALERNKFKSEAYKVRGFALMNLGRDSLAVEDFKQGLDYNPTDKYFLYYKSIAETELKRLESADSTLNLLLRRYPKFDEGFVARARLRLIQNDTVAAVEDLDRALKLTKTQLTAYLMKAEVEAKREQWSEALREMDEAVRLRPEIPDFYVNRAYLRYNNEDFFGAMSDYNYALQLEPDNVAALFNRALLRTEVKELDNAESDFTSVLNLEPHNFYALYNRGLVNLENGHPARALEDFTAISRQYPRFHPAYYAMAECYRNLGKTREMVNNIKRGDDLVAHYIQNPSKNPLDRPTIAPGRNERDKREAETEEEFMEKFNRLMTSNEKVEQPLSFNDKIKGRVQDRNINVSPEPAYSLSFFSPGLSLRNSTNYFRDLDNLNSRGYIDRKIYVMAGNPTPADESLVELTFSIENKYDQSIGEAEREARPIDYMARGIARTMLKNYDGAIADISKAVDGADDFTTALFARAYAYYMRAKAPRNEEEGGMANFSIDMQMAMTDLNKVLSISPGMVYAWFNKGMIYYDSNDFTSAIQCFSEAISQDPEFGEAYYNRGLAFMQQGNRAQAFADLSKAGELGVLPSYNILKRMK